MPKLYWYGEMNGQPTMVMEMLGPSLEDLFTYCGRRLSLKAVLQIGDQMLSRIELLHAKNLIHRDIKPDNFLIGTGEHATTVFMIDFGLAKRYRNPTTHAHIPVRSWPCSGREQGRAGREE